jgi:glycosyltransferase involved in cell wall biosynthesis
VTHRKGIDTLIDAIAQLADLNVLGVVAGEGDCADLESRAASRGVASRIRFLGGIDYIDDFVSGIDIGTLPSLGEGLPLCVMEMLGAGTPVVLSDISMHREFRVAGAACRLVPVGDASSFAAAIRHFVPHCRDPSLRESARRCAEQNFSTSVMLDRYLAVYDRAMRRRSGSSFAAVPVVSQSLSK